MYLKLFRLSFPFVHKYDNFSDITTWVATRGKSTSFQRSSFPEDQNTYSCFSCLFLLCRMLHISRCNIIPVARTRGRISQEASKSIPDLQWEFKVATWWERSKVTCLSLEKDVKPFCWSCQTGRPAQEHLARKRLNSTNKACTIIRRRTCNARSAQVYSIVRSHSMEGDQSERAMIHLGNRLFCFESFGRMLISFGMRRPERS